MLGRLILKFTVLTSDLMNLMTSSHKSGFTLTEVRLFIRLKILLLNKFYCLLNNDVYV